MNSTTSSRNSTESRAMELLGSGLGPETVATACGVSVSRISQLLSEPGFASEVAEKRFKNLQSHTVRDNTYDTLEDQLVKRFKDTLPLMIRPMEIMKALSMVNSLKRRGQSAPEAINQQQTVVTITMPSKIVNNFTVNANNQVISAGTQELLTLQSSGMEAITRRVKELETPDEPPI